MDLLLSKLMIFIPVVVVVIASTYLSFIGESKAKLNVLFGVSIPLVQLKDESIQNIIKAYKKSLNVITLTTLFIQILFFILIENVFLMTLICTVAVVLCVYSMSRPYTNARKALNLLKHEKAWHIHIEDVVLMDTKVSRIKHTFVVGPIYFIVVILTSVLVFLNLDLVLGARLSIFMICTLINGISMVFYSINKKSRTKVYSNNSKVNLVINKWLKESSSKMLLLFVVINNVFCIIISFFWLHETFLFVVGITALMMYLLITMAVDRKNKVYTLYVLESDDQVLEIDDDKYWKHGTYYNNPYDNALFVRKRNGVGYTINMGTKKGKMVFITVCIAIVISIALTCYFVILSV